MTVTLGHLAELIGGSVLPAGTDADAAADTSAAGTAAGTAITGVELNAAETPEGGLFAALPGTRVHGASYADQ